jgi:hypothetical protein
MTWMHNGYFVRPIRGSYRRCAGGYCVDVRSDDDRTTVSYWTAPADQVRDESHQPYREPRSEGL